MRPYALLSLAPILMSAPALAGEPASYERDDASPQFSLNGLIFADAAWLDGYTARYSDESEADLRLAELAVKADFGPFNAVLGYDFARDGEWRDVGLSYKRGSLRLLAGQFKEPASLDKLTPQGGTMFLEPARLTKAFGLGRRLGVSASYLGEGFTLTGGVFNGSLDDREYSGFEQGQIAYSVRGAVYGHTQETHWHLGAYARYLDYDGAGVKIGSAPHTVLGAKTLSASLTGGYAYPLADSSTLLGFEAGVSSGALFASGEIASFTVDTDSGEETLTGGYVQASYALTGESRSYYGGKGVFKPIKPARPVTEGGPGAWEVAARLDYLNLDGFQPGDSTSFTAGVNWTPVEGVRVMANYVAERGDAPGGDSDLWAVRLQVSF